jgi:hypothetical protein
MNRGLLAGRGGRLDGLQDELGRGLGLGHERDMRSRHLHDRRVGALGHEALELRRDRLVLGTEQIPARQVFHAGGADGDPQWRSAAPRCPTAGPRVPRGGSVRRRTRSRLPSPTTPRVPSRWARRWRASADSSGEPNPARLARRAHESGGNREMAHIVKRCSRCRRRGAAPGARLHLR